MEFQDPYDLVTRSSRLRPTERAESRASMAKVLVIEDDEVLARGISRALAARGHSTSVATNGETGFARLRYEKVDVCVLDLMLPGMDGWAIIEGVRSEGIGIPILVVSARASQQDVLRTLAMGADDYLIKPIGSDELAARVTVALRRGPRPLESKRKMPIQVEELFIDPDNVQAYVDGESAELTPTEFRLLYALAQDQGRVLTRGEVLKRAWGKPPSTKGRTVDGCVRQLREKIDKKSPTHRFIHTRYGVGYKFDPVPKADEDVTDPDLTARARD
jgi:DNA-binding response OmpR family regulator